MKVSINNIVTTQTQIAKIAELVHAVQDKQHYAELSHVILRLRKVQQFFDDLMKVEVTIR